MRLMMLICAPLMVFLIYFYTSDMLVKPGRHKNGTFRKMLCSTDFLLIALFAMLSQKTISAYSVIMIVGLCFSWLGDLLLDLGSIRSKQFLYGVFSFAAAHVF